MHAWGHDGHTTMLLGAARYLAETRNFDGTVYFIFQPAEELEGGGRVMVEEGLFERFPVPQVFGLHNWPRAPLGSFGIRPGPIMAAADRVEIKVRGQGGHGAMPHLCRDPLVAAAQIVVALQVIVSRNVDPVGQGVVSITQFHGGDADNVIPQEVTLRGTCRSFAAEVRDLLERRIDAIARGVAAAHQVAASVTYARGYPATVNSETEAGLAADAAADVAGEERVDRTVPPVMGAEDFAYMLEQRPGAYIFLGGGGDDDAPMLHSPDYDFNDEVLPYGASYWARLAERLLPAR
jgi:hippurate hydrolase